MNSVQQIIWNYFLNKGFTPQSIAGVMGNIDEESNFKTDNVEDGRGYSDEVYTSMVDSGIYDNFIYDSIGYGLVQWTYFSLKQDLYRRCKNNNKSISDLQCQLDQIYAHLQSEGLLNIIKNLTSIEEATKLFMLKFEKPKDQSEEAQQNRIEKAQKWYNIFNNGQREGSNCSMKYSQQNPPLVCIMTNSTCYQSTSQMNIKGVLWHSTGANNKTLKRYVQPSYDDPNYTKLIQLIGKNPNGNDWNSISVQAGVNAWIGTLADGTVTTVQTLPWDYKPWGCGSGSLGSCNNGWIQFEICEDSLADPIYFQTVYEEACQLTAYLCKLYNIDPAGTVNVNGVTVPTILCHKDSYALSLGTNHEDIYHWFTRYNKNMTDVRKDVYNLMGSSITPINQDTTSISNPTLHLGMEKNPSVKAMQEKLIQLGYNIGPDGADGDFGPNTEKAVREYQQKHNLSINGIFDTQMFLLMKEELSKLPTIVNNNKYNDVMLGSSSKDENGQYSGGQGGDQTGKEVYILNWYKGNWTSVLRPKNNNLAERIADACEKGCRNDMIGYSQSTRNTLLAQAKLVNFDLSKISSPCNCDCSSFVSTCCVCAGLPENIMFPYGNGCTTWTIAEQCLKTGEFTELFDTQYINQKDYLKRGDILLNRNGHVVIVLSNGSAVPIETVQQSNIQNNTFSYLVRVIVPILNVRQLSNENSPVVAQIKQNQIYTIVDEEGGFGKLKSGVGWINLSYTEKI